MGSPTSSFDYKSESTDTESVWSRLSLQEGIYKVAGLWKSSPVSKTMELSKSSLVGKTMKYTSRYSKKIVLKVDFREDKGKIKAMKAVSKLSGIDSVAVDMKDKKMTVVGDVDPVEVAKILRKLKLHTEIISVGSAKKEKKPEEKKKEEEGDKKKKEEKMREELERWKALHPLTQQYSVHSVEDNPKTSCVIC